MILTMQMERTPKQHEAITCIQGAGAQHFSEHHRDGVYGFKVYAGRIQQVLNVIKFYGKVQAIEFMPFKDSPVTSPYAHAMYDSWFACYVWVKIAEEGKGT